MSYTFLHFQSGASPLYVACQNNHGEIVDRLLIAKADVNLQRKVGMAYIIILRPLLYMGFWNTTRRATLGVYWCSETLVRFKYRLNNESEGLRDLEPHGNYINTRARSARVSIGFKGDLNRWLLFSGTGRDGTGTVPSRLLISGTARA